jgi:DNA-directed RNA polymerase subunit beta'
VPSQDIVLGCYYLTKSKSNAKGEGRAFSSIDDVLLALEATEVETLVPDPPALYRAGWST